MRTEAHANRLAHGLRRLGVETESVVGLCVGAHLIVVIPGCWASSAGGAYMPLDPKYPAARLHDMMDDAGSGPGTDATLADQSHQRANRGEQLALDPVDSAGEPATAPFLDLRRENLAYLIYTSGTCDRTA